MHNFFKYTGSQMSWCKMSFYDYYYDTARESEREIIV